MQDKIKKDYEDKLKECLMTKDREFQAQVEELVTEKSKLNDGYQRQMQQILREKEELTINISSLEDKLQKLELDREQLKLKYKQVASDSDKQKT